MLSEVCFGHPKENVRHHKLSEMMSLLMMLINHGSDADDDVDDADDDDDDDCSMQHEGVVCNTTDQKKMVPEKLLQT